MTVLFFFVLYKENTEMNLFLPPHTSFYLTKRHSCVNFEVLSLVDRHRENFAEHPMEYRIFQPIDRYTFDNRWGAQWNIQNRTDIYFMLGPRHATDDRLPVEYGLKLRDRKYLELKIRQTRFADGQEQWVKTIRSMKRLDPHKMESIVKILQKAHQEELIHRLQAASPLVLCYVDKIQGPKQRSDHGRLELVGLRIQFVRASNDQLPISAPLYFETACLDQSAPNPVDTDSIRSMLFAGGEHSSQPMGFPEFLHIQYAAIHSANTTDRF